MVKFVDYTLPSNGLRVILAPLAGTARLVAHCSYKVGSGMENKECLGYTHLLEHMAFKGTAPPQHVDRQRLCAALEGCISDVNAPRDELLHMIQQNAPQDQVFTKLVASGLGLNLHECDIDTIARAAGARTNAFTSTDKTSYHFTVMGPKRVVPFLAIMADTLEHLHVTDDKIASELRAVLAEMKRGNDNKVRVALQHCSPLLFEMGTPGHHSTIGDEIALARATAKNLMEFHGRYYQPYNCTLSLTGNVGDIDAMKAVIEETFKNVGVDNYNAHKAIQSVNVATAPNALARQLDRVASLVARVDNEPLRAHMETQLAELTRAHATESTKLLRDLRAPPPLPSATHRRVFDHSAVATDVLGFRIDGFNATNAVHMNVWNAVSELLTGSASARLPSSFGSYVDRHGHAGALYLISSNPHDVKEAVIRGALTRPVTSEEASRVQNAMRSRVLALQESPDDYAMHLVECISQNSMPEEVAVTRDQLNAAMQHLNYDCVQHVTVQRPPSNRIQTMLATRQEARQQNASMLPQIRKRVSTTLDAPYAIQYAPVVQPLTAAAFSFPGVKEIGGKNCIVFTHDGTLRKHLFVLRQGDPQYDLGSTVGALAAARTLHYGAGDHSLERAGIAFSLGADGGSVVVPADLADADTHLKQFTRRMTQPLDAASFEHQKTQLRQSLKMEAANPVAVCMHAAKNAVLRGADAFSYAQADAYLAKLTPQKAAKHFSSNLKPAVTLHVLVQPSPAHQMRCRTQVPASAA